jgi:hypothetical protein
MEGVYFFFEIWIFSESSSRKIKEKTEIPFTGPAQQGAGGESLRGKGVDHGERRSQIQICLFFPIAPPFTRDT